MTDKQIIDGVDASGCVYYEDGYCTISKEAYCYCSDKPNCYYKQHKRKEQECENNKIAHQMELDIYNQECFNLLEELKETLERLDQLKKENKILKQYKISKQASYEQAQKKINEVENDKSNN